MTARVSEVVRGWLGWCPNRRVTAAPQAKMGPAIYIVALICVLAILVAASLLLSPASQDVAVWAFKMDDTGSKHFVGRLPATEDTTGKLTFSTAGAAIPALPAGKYWMVIEHPGKDGSFRLMLDGEKVKLRSLNPAEGGMMIFKISGPGSLQEGDAYQALLAAFVDSEDNSVPSGNSGVVTEREYIVDK